MSDTPKLPDECKKLLDAGWMIVLRKSHLGDYSALAINKIDPTNDEQRVITASNRAFLSAPERRVTNDFEPSQALYRLTEKVLLGRIV